jgi:hypothetical protein
MSTSEDLRDEANIATAPNDLGFVMSAQPPKPKRGIFGHSTKTVDQILEERNRAQVDRTLFTERVASAPDPGAIAKLVGKDMAFLLEAAQAAAEVRSRAQDVRDTIVALLTELTRS